MKVFIFAVVILFVISAAVCINSFVIGNICDELLAEAQKLPEEPTELSSEELWNLFLENEKYLLICTNHNEIEALQSLLEEIRHKTDEGDYRYALDHFKIKLRELKESESFSLGRIM